MFNLTDTICAICTPVGTGSIAAIRISGPDSWKIVKKIFETAKKQPHNVRRSFASLRMTSDDVTFTHMHALHGYIKDHEKTIDEVVLLPYKAPKSYTAEDVIEIFCHGGSQISSMILDLCLKNGARHAKAGEFTFRAFINGKIDLTEAEAINEIIHASSEKAVFSASNILTGSLKEKINLFRDTLFDLITDIEGSIEFPLDVEEVRKNEIKLQLENINTDLKNLIGGSKEGQILREGIKVSIIGAPNVGKSSLLNCLLENERAIVTSEAGTTRDTIEEKIIIDGYPVVLVDTAGIREHSFATEPEKLGIEKSKQSLERADIALIMIDLTQKENSSNEILNLVNGKPNIVVGNKVDLVERDGDYDLAISAKHGINIDKLKKLIIEKALPASSLQLPAFSFYINQRQKELLLQSSYHIEFAAEVCKKGDPEDLICDELKKAILKLDEVSGRNISEEVIQNIFSRFCIGK